MTGGTSRGVIRPSTEPDASIARACDARLPGAGATIGRRSPHLRRRPLVRRTLVIVLATAIVGGLAGASIGLAFNKGDSTHVGPADHPSASSQSRPRRGTDLSKRFARCRRDHRRSDPDRARVLLQPGAKRAGHRARLRLRHRQARRHRDQRPRCPGSKGHSRRLQRRGVLSGQDRRLGPVDRHRGRAREGCAGLPASAASVRRLGRAGRRSGVRDREPLRARADDDSRDRQRHGPGHPGSERSRDRECDPDGRADQPRQLRADRFSTASGT